MTARSQSSRKATGIGTGRSNFKVGQIFTSSLVALSHGTNDAQKTMGVITLVLVAAGFQSTGDHVEWWVIISAATAIAVGTYMGGWRIIKTMGSGLAEIKPAQGLAAEVATASTILASSNLGFALSTTQVASGGVMGAGLGRKGGAVRWNKAGQVVTGWLFTLPAAGAVGALSAFLVMSGPVGIIADLILVVAVSIAIFQISRRNRINHSNVLSEVEGASEVIASPRQVRKAAADAKKKASKKVTAKKAPAKSAATKSKGGK
jgi:PiT family inorganic phosphate transporter